MLSNSVCVYIIHVVFAIRPPVIDCLFPVRARVPQNLPRPTVI